MNSTFKRYSGVYSRLGKTGRDIAESILRQNGIYDVNVEHISGNLTDHYDPKNKKIRLSDAIYGSNSVAALGVAAHEAGHAVQHATGYSFLKIKKCNHTHYQYRVKSCPATCHFRYVYKYV